MTLYELLLYLHLVAMAVLFGAAGIAHLAIRQIRSAREVGQVRHALGALARTKHVFPASGVLLILTGLEMARMHGTLGHGWVVMPLAAVVLLLVLGMTVNASWAKRVGMALAGEPDGAPSPALRAAISHPSIFISTHLAVGTTLSIVGLMVARPEGMLVAASVLATGALLGAGAGWWTVRARSRAAGDVLATGHRAG